VSLKIGNFISDVFTIHNGTPQGSPLSPILSVFYTAPLLDLASSWHYHDLTLYVNDGAIYVVSATKQAATKAALEGYKVVTTWLHMNGLEADPAKTELMTFTPTRRSNLTGSNIQGTQPTPDHNITTT